MVKVELSQWFVQVVDQVHEHGFGKLLDVTGELDCFAGFLFQKVGGRSLPEVFEHSFELFFELRECGFAHLKRLFMLFELRYNGTVLELKRDKELGELEVLLNFMIIRLGSGDEFLEFFFGPLTKPTGLL